MEVLALTCVATQPGLLYHTTHMYAQESLMPYLLLLLLMLLLLLLLLLL
jgi:hypothetical protein